MPGGGLVITFSDVTPSVRAPKRWSAPTQRWKAGRIAPGTDAAEFELALARAPRKTPTFRDAVFLAAAITTSCNR